MGEAAQVEKAVDVSDCHGHGNFQDDFLLTFSFLHVRAPYLPFRLLTNLEENTEDKPKHCDLYGQYLMVHNTKRDTVNYCPRTPPKTPPPSHPPLVRGQEQLPRISPQHRPLRPPLAPAAPPAAKDPRDDGTLLHRGPTS